MCYNANGSKSCPIEIVVYTVARGFSTSILMTLILFIFAFFIGMDDTVAAVKSLKQSFDDLLKFLVEIVCLVSIANLEWLKMKICLRLQETHDNHSREVQRHLDDLYNCPTPSSVIYFVVSRNFLGYLNFDLLEALIPVLNNVDFTKKVHEYKDEHDFFIMNNFSDLIKVFQQYPASRPASTVGLPEMKVHLKSPWKTKSLYYWKELVASNVDWAEYLIIEKIEFNCVTITYRIMPFILPRIVKDLSDNKIIEAFSEIGAAFTIPDKAIYEQGVDDNEWIATMIKNRSTKTHSASVYDNEDENMKDFPRSKMTSVAKGKIIKKLSKTELHESQVTKMLSYYYKQIELIIYEGENLAVHKLGL